MGSSRRVKFNIARGSFQYLWNLSITMEEETRPYWVRINGLLIDECLRDDFGVEPRTVTN